MVIAQTLAKLHLATEVIGKTFTEYRHNELFSILWHTNMKYDKIK